MDNAKREHDKLMEEGRVQEAKRRKEDATKYEEEIKVLEDNHQKAIKAIEDSKRRLIIVGSVAVLGLVVASAGMVALEVLAPEIALVVGAACKLVPAALNVAESVMTLMDTEGSENENEQQGESLESEGQAQI